MKKAIKKLSIWAFTVAMIVTVVMPATSCLARPRLDFVPAPSEESLKWGPLTPKEERELEAHYWGLIYMYFHTKKAYFNCVDGYDLKEEIPYVAHYILENEIGMPVSDVESVEDPYLTERYRFWANFFCNLMNGGFTRREARKWLRYERCHYGKW